MIREATTEDIPEIVGMIKAMLDDLELPWEESYIVNMVLKSLKLAPCFLAMKDDKIIAINKS